MSDNSITTSSAPLASSIEQEKSTIQTLTDSLFKLCNIQEIETNAHFQQITESTSQQFKECQFPDNEYHTKGIADVCFWISLCLPYASFEDLRLFAAILAYLSVVDDACDQEKDLTGELRDELESHIELLTTIESIFNNNLKITSTLESPSFQHQITSPTDSPYYCSMTSPNESSTLLALSSITTSPFSPQCNTVQHKIEPCHNPSLELGKKVLFQLYTSRSANVSSKTRMEIDHFQNVRFIMMETFEHNVGIANLWAKDSSPTLTDYMKMRENDSLAKILMYFGFMLAMSDKTRDDDDDVVIDKTQVTEMGENCNPFEELRKSEFYKSAVKVCILVNDICSYPKDLKCEIQNNYISLWMKEHEGSNLEESFMHGISELVKCVRIMNQQLEELSSKKDDDESIRLFSIFKNFKTVAVGYMGWCLKSPRFKHENHPVPQLKKMPKTTTKDNSSLETTSSVPPNLTINTPSAPVTYLDVIRNEKRKRFLLNNSNHHCSITIDIGDDSLSDGKVTTLSKQNNICNDELIFDSFPDVAFQQVASQTVSVSNSAMDEIISIAMIKRKEHDVVNVTDLRRSELAYNHILNGVPLIMMVLHYFGIMSWWQIFLIQQYCTIRWTLSLHTLLHACAKFDFFSEVLIGMGNFGQFFTLSAAKYGHKTHHMFTETEKDADYVFFATNNVLLLLIKCLFFAEYYSYIYVSHLVKKLKANENLHDAIHSGEFKHLVRFIAIMTVKILFFIAFIGIFSTSFMVVILSARFASSYVLAIFTQLIHKLDMVLFFNRMNKIFPRRLHLDRLLNLIFGSNIHVVKYHAIHHEFPWISPTSYYPYLMNCERELKQNTKSSTSNSSSTLSTVSGAPVNYSIAENSV
nr:unnamed protein product [Naegleria fowleri]